MTIEDMDYAEAAIALEGTAMDPEDFGLTPDGGTSRVNASSFEESDFVEWDGKRGVILEVHSGSFEFAGESYESDGTMYVVGHEDGTDVVPESELTDSTWNEDVGEEGEPEKVARANATNFYVTVGNAQDPDEVRAALQGDVTTNLGFSRFPPSWRKSDKPARLIALHAWAKMGASFSGCFQELQSNRLCAAFKDTIYQTPYWR